MRTYVRSLVVELAWLNRRNSEFSDEEMDGSVNIQRIHK